VDARNFSDAIPAFQAIFFQTKPKAPDSTKAAGGKILNSANSNSYF